MSHLEASELLRALQARRRVGPDVQPQDGTAPVVVDRPWYIGLLLGASGWLAGGFLLGFVALLFRPNTAPAAAFAGVFLLASAFGLFKADRDGAFTSQLALALSVAGQCLVLFAMAEHRRGIAGIAGAAFVLQATMVLLMPNRLHRVMSTLFAMIAWALLLRFGLFGEPHWGAPGATTASLPAALLGWALTWLPPGLGLWWLVRTEPQWMARGWQPVLRPVLAGLVVGLAFATIATHPLESFRWWGDAPARPDWLALWPLLSAGAALFAVAIAFALRSRSLMGGCIVAVLLHVSLFYYELGTSLLLKSLLMLLLGAALLLLARRFSPAQEGRAS